MDPTGNGLSLVEVSLSNDSRATMAAQTYKKQVM
jgi:hypothetical protein